MSDLSPRISIVFVSFKGNQYFFGISNPLGPTYRRLLSDDNSEIRYSVYEGFILSIIVIDAVLYDGVIVISLGADDKVLAESRNATSKPLLILAVNQYRLFGVNPLDSSSLISLGRSASCFTLFG